MNSIPEVIYGHNSDRILITGPKDTGKTCTAWAIAYDLTIESPSTNPLIICNQKRLESQFPYRTYVYDDIDKNIEEECFDLSYLNRISLKYITNIHELKLVITSLFAFNSTTNGSTNLPISIPNCIIIEDLNAFIDPYGTMNRNESEYQTILLNVIQLLNNSLLYLEKQIGHTVKLIITDICDIDSYIKMCFITNLIDTHIKLITPLTNMRSNSTHSMIASIEAYRMMNVPSPIEASGNRPHTWCYSVFKIGSLYIKRPKKVYSYHDSNNVDDSDGYLCVVPSLP